MTGFQRGASTINRKKWSKNGGVLEKISALKVRLYSLASENSQKPAKKQMNYVLLPLIATAYR